MMDELVEFDKRAGIEQLCDSLAGGQLAGLVLAGDLLLAAAQARGADIRPVGAVLEGSPA